ncbi:hypothetical protein BJ742DRAFT_798263 [Cladochytrium replicatum]|nr:hypothetical protein BJ742DRAFT_798263 [Cladochytrium replicatum]
MDLQHISHKRWTPDAFPNGKWDWPEEALDSLEYGEGIIVEEQPLVLDSHFPGEPFTSPSSKRVDSSLVINSPTSANQAYREFSALSRIVEKRDEQISSHLSSSPPESKSPSSQLQLFYDRNALSVETGLATCQAARIKLGAVAERVDVDDIESIFDSDEDDLLQVLLSCGLHKNLVLPNSGGLQKESPTQDGESVYQVRLGSNGDSIPSSEKGLSDSAPRLFSDEDLSYSSLSEFLTEYSDSEDEDRDKASPKTSPPITAFQPGSQKSLSGLAVKRLPRVWRKSDPHQVTKDAEKDHSSPRSDAIALSEPKKRSASVPVERSAKRHKSVQEAEDCSEALSDVSFERYCQASTFLEAARVFPEAFVPKMPSEWCPLFAFSDGDPSQHWEVANNIAYTEDVVSYSRSPLRDIWLSKLEIPALPRGYSSMVKFTQPRTRPDQKIHGGTLFNNIKKKAKGGYNYRKWARADLYILGHPSGKPFRSSNEFSPHLYWLIRMSREMMVKSLASAESNRVVTPTKGGNKSNAGMERCECVLCQPQSASSKRVRSA